MEKTTGTTQVQQATTTELLEMLKKADVGALHYGGWVGIRYTSYRSVFLDKDKASVSFTLVQERVEQLYDEKMARVRREVANWEGQPSLQTKKVKKPVDPGSEMIFQQYLLDLLVPPAVVSKAGNPDGFRYPYPQMTEAQEKEILAVLDWREEVDSILERLFNKNKAEITAFGKKCWFHSTRETFKAVSCKEDREMAKNMIHIRKVREVAREAVQKFIGSTRVSTPA